VAAWSGSDTLYFEAPEALAAGLVTEIFDAPEASAIAAPPLPPADPDSEPEALAKELLPQLRDLFSDSSRFAAVLKSLAS
jgi:hypothetical protein